MQNDNAKNVTETSSKKYSNNGDAQYLAYVKFSIEPKLTMIELIFVSGSPLKSLEQLKTPEKSVFDFNIFHDSFHQAGKY